MGPYNREISAAAIILAETKKAAAFCGSGVSAESGISTFRDPGGIWERINPMEAGTSGGLISSLAKNPEKLMGIFVELLEAFEKAECNPGHLALVDLEKMGILETVITQNVDNLQDEAGSGNIIEMHGNLFRMACLSCGIKKKLDRKPLIHHLKQTLRNLKDYSLASLATLAPRCDACGSIMRPDIVMFGEAVQDLPRAFEAGRDCDVMLVLGTSGVVYPAAELPFEAKRKGADIIVVNPNENPFEEITDVYIPMKTGAALPAIVVEIKKTQVGKKKSAGPD
jgi:NAD-dependent deacetylase